MTSPLACSKCAGVGSTCASSPGSSSVGHSRCTVSTACSRLLLQHTFTDVPTTPSTETRTSSAGRIARRL
ncbi:hypothetical protein [Kitasatospora purpeofusca]|uniref:hypothetical protein n=1 Tax=Kitasatospora purpeofusca TaxID=67352 RepID=UPI0012FF0393|nr:hypothetical protein [Kitasatospora purpeofusca]